MHAAVHGTQESRQQSGLRECSFGLICPFVTDLSKTSRTRALRRSQTQQQFSMMQLFQSKVCKNGADFSLHQDIKGSPGTQAFSAATLAGWLQGFGQQASQHWPHYQWPQSRLGHHEASAICHAINRSCKCMHKQTAFKLLRWTVPLIGRYTSKACRKLIP